MAEGVKGGVALSQLQHTYHKAARRIGRILGKDVDGVREEPLKWELARLDLAKLDAVWHSKGHHRPIVISANVLVDQVKHLIVDYYAIGTRYSRVAHAERPKDVWVCQVVGTIGWKNTPNQVTYALRSPTYIGMGALCTCSRKQNVMHHSTFWHNSDLKHAWQ